MKESPASWRAHALLLVPMGFLLYAAIRLWPHTLDDAYISMQYAKNLLDGHGLTFSPGQRVEGFSNPLWVLLLALGGALFPMVSWAKTLGLLCSLATAGVVWKLLQLLCPPKQETDWPWLPLLGVTLWVLHPGVAYYAVAGLETSLFSLLVLSGLFLHLDDEGSSRCYIPLALASITRPEGALFLLGLGAVRLFTARDSRTAAAKALGLALLLPLGYSLFRGLYFGDVFPNTFYAKPGQFWAKPGLGVGYIQGFFLAHGSVAAPWSNGLTQALAAVGGLALLALAAWGAFKHKPGRTILGIFVLYLGFIFYSGGDWMTQYRLFQPILAPLYLLPILGLAALPAKHQPRVLGFLGLVTLLYAGQARHFWLELEANQNIDHAHRSQNNVKMARWMAKNLAPKASIATDEIGAIGFYTKLKVIDLWGLVDKPIGRYLHGQRFNPYAGRQQGPRRSKIQAHIAKMVLARKPTYILLDYQGPYPGKGPFKERYINPLTMPQLYQALRLNYAYVRAFSIMPKPPFKHFLLFKRVAHATR